ncbi:MAG TPA: FAD-dependent oxidoreductase [Ktedonobacteraceae bacterium]|nr:FAD-dependent oxidoreductase [Ktedonobacteraceae bacterium]
MVMRTIVIGAGIIGTCTALRLAQQGAQVTLIEADLPGDGTTGASFAWVNAGSKQPREYFALNVAGMIAHRRFMAEWPATPWLIPTGNLEWGDTPEAQERLIKRVERLRAWDYSASLLSPRQVVSTLEPDLLLEPTVEAVAFYPEESHVYPRLFLTYLLRAARTLGVELSTGEKVVDFEMHGDRVSGVVLASGSHLSADVVVCCCGRWTQEVVSLAGMNLPLISPEEPVSSAVGLLVLSSGICADIRRVVHAPGINIRPDGSSRLLLHSDELDRQVTLQTQFSPPPHAAEEVLKRAGKVVRNMQSARIESATLGIRPIPADGLSAVGWVPGVEGLYVIVTHSGVTLGPALAELATSEIHGQEEAILAPFRPDRFR